MSLLTPLGLLALLTLPLIVLLHLMRERRRRVVVPSLLLWQLMPRRQEAQRRRRLPLTLLLLLHLLAAALLALALARPQWLTSLLGREQHLAVIIDTSASMAAPTGGVGAGSRLDAARDRALALVAGLSGRDTLTLIVAGPEARLLDSAGPAGIARLRAALNGLTSGGVGSDIVGALTLAAADMQGQPAGRAVVITDAALPTLDADLRRAPQGLAVAWEQVGASLPNRAMITFAARPRGASGPVQVYARAANYSDTPFSSFVRLYGDGRLLDTRPVSFSPQGNVELTWVAPAGMTLLRVEIDGGDRLPADDTAALSLNIARPLRTLLVSSSPAAVERALKSIPGVSLRVIAPADYAGASTPGVDLTVLDGTLPERWPPGAVLAINPPTSGRLLSVSGRTGSPAPGAADLRSGPDALFDGVSLGSVEFGPAPFITPPDWARALLSRGDQPLILRGSVGQSEVAIWAFDLAHSNLTTRLAFPLLLARTVRDLVPAPLPSSALAGQIVALRPDPRADTIELTDPGGAVSRLPVPRGQAARVSLADPGVYALRELAGAGEIFAGQLPVNAGSARESDLTPRPLPAATEAPPAVASDPARDSRPLWPWLAAAALAVMFGEWAYVHARRVGAAASR
jgi:hypothetical protein